MPKARTRRHIASEHTAGLIRRGPYGTALNIEALKEAFCSWICEHKYTHFLTLNFNRETTTEGARIKLKDFLARLDRHFLGPKWSRKRDERTFLVAVPENIRTNLHFHCHVRFPNRAEKLDLDTIRGFLEAIWHDLIPSGSICLKPIDDRSGLLRYTTKQFRDPEVFGQIIVSDEFWPSDCNR